MGKSLFIGVLVLTVIFAAITITVQRHSSKVPEMLSENLAEQRAANLAAYALQYGIKRIKDEQIGKDSIPSGGGYYTDPSTPFNVMNGTIDSLRYSAFDADKDTIKIIANVTCIVGADTARHESEATLANVIDYHPDEQVGCWSFDEGGGTTAADGSDSGNDGILGGGDAAPDWTTDTSYGDGALDFDGDDDHVDLDTLVSSTYENNFTVAAWVKPDITWDWGLIAAEEGSWLLRSCVTKGWWFFPAKVKFVFNIVTDSGFPFVSIQKTENDMTINDWHYIVATYNHDYSPTQAEISIQIADEAFKPGNTPSDWKAIEYISKVTREPGNSTFIGGWHDIDTHWTPWEWLNNIINHILESLVSFDGKIDEVMLFNRVMTDDEINQLYQFNGVKKPEIIYWQE